MRLPVKTEHAYLRGTIPRPLCDGGSQSVHEGRRRSAMHLLLIIIVLMLAFPGFSRFIGGCLSVIFWLIFAVVVLAVFGALSNCMPDRRNAHDDVAQDMSKGQSDGDYTRSGVVLE
jgi:hypothetical protein